MRHVRLVSRKPEKGQTVDDLVNLFEAVVTFVFALIQSKQLSDG